MSQEVVNGFVLVVVVVVVVVPFSSYCILFCPNGIDLTFTIFVYHLHLLSQIPSWQIIPIPSTHAQIEG